MNLLTDRLIRARLFDGEIEIHSLSEVYAAMALERVAAFPALRPHQRHAWHAFLAQLATIAMHRAKTSVPPQTPAEWQTLLRNLTTEYANDEPWRLIVDDSTKPAFMQCPSPNGLDEYRGRVTTPDDLDVLVTSKNHDVKRTIALGGAPEDWIFALVDLQTMAGFLGFWKLRYRPHEWRVLGTSLPWTGPLEGWCRRTSIPRYPAHDCGTRSIAERLQ